MRPSVNAQAKQVGKRVADVIEQTLDDVVGHKLDGRTERWRQHRLERRREFVDAALVALERHGPTVSMEQIAAAAGVAKPKLYRHFRDKADLINAIQERMAEVLWDRLGTAFSLDVPPRELIDRSVRAYVNVVDEYPSAFVFMLSGTFMGSTDPVLEEGRRLAGAVVALIAEMFRVLGVDPEGAEPWGHGAAAAVGGATFWWLENRTMSKEKLVAHLSTMIWGSTDAIMRSKGIVLDPDRPIVMGIVSRTDAPVG